MGLREVLTKALIGESPRERQGDAVRKQDAERRAEIDPGLKRLIRQHNLLPKPYDAKELRDYAENPIAQAYIDTLAQDAATADWSLVPRFEQSDVPESEIEEGERTIKGLHPELSFRDLREYAARDLLELGDAVWVKHFTPGGDLAEAVPVDSGRMFKKVDEHGFTDGYAQASFSTARVEVEFDLEEVVWFSWAVGGRNSYQYGYGPTEKGQPIIEILDELSDKELKDLKEGAPPGIVSAHDSADNPVPVDEFERVDNEWELKEGQRHRHIVSRGSWEFVPLSPGYEELQLLGRSKHWIQTLGSVYKVNSNYAGFGVDDSSRHTSKSEAEAFRQRGFRVMLRYLEEAINKQLIWPHISDDLMFTHEEARTIEERQEIASLRESQAQAGKELADAGLDVQYDNGRLEVQDGEMEEGSSGGSMFAGGEGGVEMAVRSKAADEPLSRAIELDEWLFKAYEEQIVPKDLDDIEKQSWTGDESVPEFVREKVSEVIDGGAIFDQFESIPGDVRDEVEGIFEDKLTQPQGWSLRSLTDELKEVFPGVSRDDLETVARTESAAVLNKAREEGYQDRPEAATMDFYWQGPSDSRTTELCEALKEETNPQHGGEPMSLNDLKRLAERLHDKHFSNLEYRGIEALHPNERHTFVRSVSV